MGQRGPGRVAEPAEKSVDTAGGGPPPRVAAGFPSTQALFFSLGRAVKALPDHATAFAYRDAGCRLLHRPGGQRVDVDASSRGAAAPAGVGAAAAGAQGACSGALAGSRSKRPT